MRAAIFAVAVLGIASAPAYQDNPDEKAQFEVASIKPSDRDGRGLTHRMDGGPGTSDPTRMHIQNLSLLNLVLIAYEINYTQLIAPDYLQTENFTIDAKLPEGATKKQVPFMIRNLLIERFKLAAHHEQREMPQSILTVAKGGIKMKEHVDQPKPASDAPPKSWSNLQKDADGYPILPGPGIARMSGRVRWRAEKEKVAMIVGRLTAELGHPVKDETGLKGEYDFTLSWFDGNAADSEAGPDLIAAVQQQLGLKLETRKAPLEVLVVDHIEKTPTEN